MSSINKQILNDIMALQDKKYQEFHSNLCPGTSNIIGVRVPDIRKYVKTLQKKSPNYLEEISINDFKYYEEILVYGLYIATSKMDDDKLFYYLDKFVPLIDNWAICDIVCGSIKVTDKNKEAIYKYIKKYKNSKKEFERRFFVVMLFHFLDDDYLDKIINDIDQMKMDEYYVSMAIAWLVSIIYIKQKDKGLKYLNDNNLDTKTYNKALQKIIESTRISKEEKNFIRSLKR